MIRKFVDLLIEEQLLFEVFLEDYTVEHDEPLPELDGSKCKLRVCGTDGIHQELHIEPPVMVGRENKMWIPREDQGEAPYDWETHLVTDGFLAHSLVQLVENLE
jgi:hypothetical protein